MPPLPRPSRNLETSSFSELTFDRIRSGAFVKHSYSPGGGAAGCRHLPQIRISLTLSVHEMPATGPPIFTPAARPSIASSFWRGQSKPHTPSELCGSKGGGHPHHRTVAATPPCPDHAMPLGGVASALRPSDFGGSSANVISLNKDEVMEKLRKRAQAHSYTGEGRDWERALRPASKNNSGVFALTHWYSLVRKTFKMTKQDITDELIRSVTSWYTMVHHAATRTRRGCGAGGCAGVSG